MNYKCAYRATSEFSCPSSTEEAFDDHIDLNALPKAAPHFAAKQESSVNSMDIMIMEGILNDPEVERQRHLEISYECRKDCGMSVDGDDRRTYVSSEGSYLRNNLKKVSLTTNGSSTCISTDELSDINVAANALTTLQGKPINSLNDFFKSLASSRRNIPIEKNVAAVEESVDNTMRAPQRQPESILAFLNKPDTNYRNDGERPCIEKLFNASMSSTVTGFSQISGRNLESKGSLQSYEPNSNSGKAMELHSQTIIHMDNNPSQTFICPSSPQSSEQIIYEDEMDIDSPKRLVRDTERSNFPASGPPKVKVRPELVPFSGEHFENQYTNKSNNSNHRSNTIWPWSSKSEEKDGTSSESKQTTRNINFEIDEDLWDIVPRRSLCRAMSCQYRNNATLVSNRKHYHARCSHVHQTGEKRGMPFHHHQLEKIKKHQRAHQTQNHRISTSSTSSPVIYRAQKNLSTPQNKPSPLMFLSAGSEIVPDEKPWTPRETERLRVLAEAPGGGGWTYIANLIGNNRSEDSCKARWTEICENQVKDAKIGVGSWSPEEDQKLKELVGHFGLKWAQICMHMPGRVGKQCRERYLNHLDPNLKKTPWTEEEDALLVHLHSKCNNSWAFIARNIEGRCDNDVKNRWNLIQRRVGGKSTLNGSSLQDAANESFITTTTTTFPWQMNNGSNKLNPFSSMSNAATNFKERLVTRGL